MSLDPIELVLEGAKKAGLPHGVPDEIAKDYGYEPDPTPDPYSTMSVDEMRKFTSKANNLAKAEELGVEVFKSWTELKICEAIFNYFN